MNDIKVFPIGIIKKEENEVKIVIDPEYRNVLLESKPYKKGPDVLGVFATRSPERPNPIAVSNVDIAYIDEENGTIGLYYIDADDNTPLLDLKPYTPSIDRIEHSSSPKWCSHWPKSYEESGDFDWEGEFTF